MKAFGVKKLPLLIFLGGFLLYLSSLGPSLVPYRDAGEMATTAPTLGILHPPGYPLYSILGNIFSRLPFAGPAYRLNLLSAVAMAGAWALFFLFLWSMSAWLAAAEIVCLGMGSYQFWAHALVPEMYTLNLLFLSGALLAIARQKWNLAALLVGLGIANRADLILSLPALGILLWHVRTPARAGDSGVKGGRGAPSLSFPVMALFAALGGGVYAFLPIRAARHPWLNWDDPSTLERLLRTLLRSGYHGTLDLLSQSYRTGENFFSELGLYGAHLWKD